ncbi:MAG: rod shape-determining protein MreD, partial [Moraxellaceae bacterium]
MQPREYFGNLNLGSGRNQIRDPLIAIVISIIIASVLMVYPLPYAVAAWRPLFFLLLTLFWVLCQPAWCGIWFAFFLGLASDLMLDAM